MDIEQEKNKLIEDIKEKKRLYKKLSSKGTWRNLYNEVRKKTIELNKDENLNNDEKILNFKIWYNEEFNFIPKNE